MFRCPITHAVYVDPVQAEDGKTYERWAIERWLESHFSSPLIPSKCISVAGLRPNAAVRAAVAADETLRAEWTETRAAIASRMLRAGNVHGAAALEYPVAMTRMAVGCVEEREYIGWIDKAAAAGERNAMRLLGEAYAKGLGKERDPDAALAWYVKAANLGDCDAIEEALRMALARGSLADARHWAAKGAEQSPKCRRVQEALKLT